MDAKLWVLLQDVPAVEIMDFLIEERRVTLDDLERMYSLLGGRQRVGNRRAGGVIFGDSSSANPPSCRCRRYRL